MLGVLFKCVFHYSLVYFGKSSLVLHALSGLWMVTDVTVWLLPRHTVQDGFRSLQSVCVHVSPKNIFPVFPSMARSAVYICFHVEL